MKSIRYLALLTAFSFLSGIPVPAGAASSGEFAARENRHPALLPEQAIAAQEEMAREQAVYEVLLAEVALQRGNIDLAIQTYADLAQRTRDPQILERTVEVAEFARRFDLARKTAQLWLDIDPASQRARKMLTSVLIASNRLNELAPHLIRVLENDMVALPGNLLGLNALFARNTDRLAVFRLIDAVCQPFSGFAEAHYAVALAATGAYMGERARREMIQALELRPDWEAAALLYAQLLMRESSDEAVEFMENFLKDNPGAAQARLLFARILIGEHRHTDARHQFDRLLRDAPDDPEVVYAVAMLALQSGDKAFAETRLRSLVTIDKTLERNAAHYFLGQIAEDDERVDEAVAHYAQVASGEHHLPARMRQAALLFAQGKIDEGRESLRDASTDRPEERIRVQIVEAALLRDAGRVQEAFDFLEQQLAENPEHSDFLYETALLAERLNRMELMENRLRRVIELIPDNPQAYNALGYAYADRNMRLPEARQLIEKALALAPDDAAILDSMGWVLFRQGDLQGALSYLERSYGRLENPEIAAHLSEVLWSMGRRDDALRMLSDAQKKFPYNAVLSETVRRLAPE